MGIYKQSFSFGAHSLSILATVHPDLQKLCHYVLDRSPIDFGITQGNRTVDEEAALVAAGKSHTMHSRHIGGHAVDFDAFVDGLLTWEHPSYIIIGNLFVQCGDELNIPVVSGGNWEPWKDWDHVELDKRMYPDAT